MSILKIRDADGNMQEILAIRGEPGKDGVDGKDGEPGKDGADGYTPVRGTDYWTDADRTQMVTDVISALPIYNGEVV